MKTILHFTYILFLLSFLGIGRVVAQIPPPDADETCGVQATLPSSDQVGGRWIPSATPNSFFRILVIFAQFPDDGYTQISDWPLGQPPTYMNTFIDSDPNQNSKVGNMTQYFWEMSQNTFKIIGNCYYVTAPETRQWYTNNAYNRAQINKDIIQKLNQTVSFSTYDNWTKTSDYHFQNTSDGLVDMICVIWRNIHQDASFPYLQEQFGFSGEASLGSDIEDVEFTVDNGARKVAEGSPVFGVPGSGLTIAVGYNGHGYVQNSTIHELGHYLLGGNEYHICGGTWGMMWNWACRSNCANAFERNKLGWITIQEYDYNPPNPISLGDYVTTGQAVRIALPNTSPQEYFLLENHQRISMFDTPDDNYPEQGLYVLHQFGATPNTSGTNGIGESPRLISADGKYVWTFDHYAPWINGVIVPVFKRGAASPVNGYFDSDLIPYTDPQTGQGESNFIYAYVDPVTGKDNDTPIEVGDGNDGFTLSHHLFSGSTNPPTLTSGLVVSPVAFDETYNTGGIVKVQLYTNWWGGTLTQNTTISGNATITGNLTVNSGVALTIAAGTTLNFLSGSSLTINGTLISNVSLTIPSGSTMIINPGAALQFASGTSLTANGVLSVNGTLAQPITITSTGSTSPGAWGSIILSGSGANYSTLSHANINYGIEVDVLSANNVTIQNCNIENNSGNGIYLYSSPNCQMQYNTIANSNANHGIYIYGGSNENCYNNVIYKTNHNKQGAGIFYYGSSGTVGQNDIDYFDWGIQALWGASPSAEISSSITYNNRITNCQNGLMVYGNSYCNFGVLTSYPSGGLNSIYNNGYNAAVGDYYVTFPSGLYAECDWWGSNPPPSRFYIGSESYLYWTYPESADPWSKYPLPSIQDKGSVKGEIAASVASTSTQTSTQSTEAADPSSSDSLLAGIGLRQEGKFEEARDFFKSYLNNHPDDQAAYVYLYSCADSETAPSLIQYFNALPKQAAKEQKMLLSYLYLRQGDSKSAKQVNDGIISANPNTILAAKAKLDNFYIALYNDNDLNNAAVILKDVERSAGLFASTGSSTTPMEISDAEHALAVYVDPQTGEMPNINTEQSKNESAVTTSSSAQSGLMANYPNPFNPSTNISYNLPTSGHVTLKVYDVLGREVKTLVNEDQALGTYSVRFDASRLASGVYLYRLTAPGIMVTKKMVVTK